MTNWFLFNLDVWPLVKATSAITFLYAISTVPYFRLIFESRASYGGLLVSKNGRPGNTMFKRLIFSAWLVSNVVNVITSSTLLHVFFITINFLFCRYFFVSQRFNGVARGAGAPGYMIYWLSFFQLLLAAAFLIDVPLATTLYIIHFDFALIMISAGIYKIRTGYLHGRGMEYGLANPMWSRFHKFFSMQKVDSPIFLFFNVSAVFVEIIIGFSLLFSLRILNVFAGILLILMFLLLLILTRLGFLPITMIAVGLILAQPSSFDLGDLGILQLIFMLSVCFFSLMTVIHNWTSYENFYIRNRFFRTMGKVSTWLSGGIIWSVFSANHTEILVEVLKDGKFEPTQKFNVHHGIASTSLATFRRYFPTKSDEWNLRAKTFLRYLSVKNSNPSLRLSMIMKLDKSFSFVWIEEWSLIEKDDQISVSEITPSYNWLTPTVRRFGFKLSKNLGDYSQG
jgi:hypothetical protein